MEEKSKLVMTLKSYFEECCGYTPMTTFWHDFSMAECVGNNAVVETFKLAFNEWKFNYKYLTELVMVLNHKIFQWYENNKTLSNIYNQLWEIADNYAVKNLHDDELDYFYKVTD